MAEKSNASIEIELYGDVLACEAIYRAIANYAHLFEPTQGTSFALTKAEDTE